jgi:uncharacterized membrane protein YjjP (DUF1212 family)
MGEDENGGIGPEGRDAEGRPGGPGTPMVGAVMKTTTRFSREVVATMIALASTAFGVVAALAWNAAITAWFNNSFGSPAQATAAANVSALFIYAFVATIVGVVVIVLLGRLAARINAEPVEFKYPAAPRQ